MEIQDLLSKADAGDAGAMCELALHYAKNGDTGKSGQYLTMALKKGHPYAFYLAGIGLRQNNHPDWIKFLQRAAELKSPDAMEDLGDAYKEGKGVPKDLNKAVHYYEQFATYGELSEKVIAANKILDIVSKDYYPKIELLLSSASAQIEKEFLKIHSLDNFNRCKMLGSAIGGLYEKMADGFNILSGRKQKKNYNELAFESYEHWNHLRAGIMILDGTINRHKLYGLLHLRQAKLFEPEQYTEYKKLIAAVFNALEASAEFKKILVSTPIESILESIDITPYTEVDNVIDTMISEFGNESLNNISDLQIVSLAKKYGLY